MGRWTPLTWLRGVPYQTTFPEFRSIRGNATNVDTALRWDSKQRIRAAASGPAFRMSRYEAGVDSSLVTFSISAGRDLKARRTNIFANLLHSGF